MDRVRRLATIVGLWLLVLWVPATCHCQLETVLGGDWLACVSDFGQASHQEKDCGADGCSVVESGHFFVPAKEPVRAPLAPLVLTIVLADASPTGLPGWQAVGIPDDIPPELPKTWQFSSRTALPPRAPTLPS
jgi:hypothetical protein